MRLHRAPTAAALLLAATLALSACSDDEPDSPEPSPGPSTTSASPTATPSAKPTQPVLPEAAKKATEAGARAFITYYWDLINYAQVTGDVKALKKASGPNCTRCAAGVNAIAEVYQSGGHLTDGNYRPVVRSIKEIGLSSKNLVAYEARAEVANDEHVSVDSDGRKQTFDASTVSNLLYLLWTGQQWRVDVMERG